MVTTLSNTASATKPTQHTGQIVQCLVTQQDGFCHAQMESGTASLLLHQPAHQQVITNMLERCQHIISWCDVTWKDAAQLMSAC